MDHFCHEHPLGGERRMSRCGHWCDDKPCLWAHLCYRVRRLFGRGY